MNRLIGLVFLCLGTIVLASIVVLIGCADSNPSFLGKPVQCVSWGVPVVVFYCIVLTCLAAFLCAVGFLKCAEGWSQT
jgi:hypothetical protein